MIKPTHVFWFLLVVCILAFCYRVYAEFVPQGPFGNHIWYSMEGKGLKEWKLEDHKPKEVPKVAPKTVIKPIIKVVEKSLPVKATNDTFDLDKFAVAVSIAETGGCKKGSALSHKNCFGIMTWDKNGKRSFKRYATIEDSFKDFKHIWSEHYGNKYPTMGAVKKWTGNDRANNWIRIVSNSYYN